MRRRRRAAKSSRPHAKTDAEPAISAVLQSEILVSRSSKLDSILPDQPVSTDGRVSKNVQKGWKRSL